jgi:hypothetical protein
MLSTPIRHATLHFRIYRAERSCSPYLPGAMPPFDRRNHGLVVRRASGGVRVNTPDGTVDEMPLAERIEILADLCADPPVDADVPELTGLLGEAYLDRYDVDGDVDLLTLAIGRIEQALTSAPAHPDALRWRYRLGLAYAERADRARDVADYGHAIELLEVVFEALPEGDFDRDLTAVVLADAHWDRFRTVRAFESRAPDAVLGDARRTAATVGLLAAAVHDEELAAYGRLVHGCALIAVSDASDRRPDLDAAIAVLAEAFRGVDAGTPRFVMAGAELCLAYRQRARLDDDPADLALAVQVGQRAADTCAEDDPAVGMLYDFLAPTSPTAWRSACVATCSGNAASAPAPWPTSTRRWACWNERWRNRPTTTTPWPAGTTSGRRTTPSGGWAARRAAWTGRRPAWTGWRRWTCRRMTGCCRCTTSGCPSRTT